MIFLAAAISVGAINSGTNLLYVMVATLLSFLLFSLVFGWINMGGLSVRRRSPETVYAGQWSRMDVDLINGKRYMSSYGIEVSEQCEPIDLQGAATYFLVVPPRSTVRRRIRVRFPRRGLIKLDGIELTSCAPFGFQQIRRRTSDQRETLVYPRLLPVQRWAQLHAPEAGMHESSAKGEGVSLFSIRDFQDGDPAKKIHWKLSSKGTGVKVRESEHENTNRARLVLDYRCPPSPTDEDREQFERAISVTASIAKYFLDESYEIALWSAAGAAPRGAGPPHVSRIMTALALIEIEAFQAETPIPPAPHGWPDIWITPHGERGGAGPGAAGPSAVTHERFVVDSTRFEYEPD